MCLRALCAWPVFCLDLDLERAFIVFARFVRMASVLPCLAARRDIFKSVFGAPLGTSVALGPYGCTEKSMGTEKNVFYGDRGSLICS